MKRLLMFTMLLGLSSTLFAQIKEDVIEKNGELFFRTNTPLSGEEKGYKYSVGICDLPAVKNILLKRKDGRYTYENLDFNATLDEYGHTAFNIAAIRMSNTKCRNVARWLSDFGIRDGQVWGGGCICKACAIQGTNYLRR